MNWNSFNTYGDSPQNAFETFCNQIFERFLQRTYLDELNKFRVINGAGGDGGIEAYGLLKTQEIVAVQAKWFRNVIKAEEIGQIRKSITTAIAIRPKIVEYIICIPHNVSSIKHVRGKKDEAKKLSENHEENTIDAFCQEVSNQFPNLKITWWFEKDLMFELQHVSNEGLHKFWFDKEIISLEYLKKQFINQKKGWLHERYVPELHGQGVINEEYQKLCFSSTYRNELLSILDSIITDINICTREINKFRPTNQLHPELNIELEGVTKNLVDFFNEFQNIRTEIINGNDFYKPKIVEEVYLWKIKLELEKLIPTNIQKNILPKLILSLENIHKDGLNRFLEHISLNFNQSIRLILGNPGTGKTHGLANCVDIHLEQNAPAIIIQAKGCPNNNWTEILSSSLELNNWKKEEVFSALESIATRTDIQKAINWGEENINSECTKVIICIDGLEEDIENEKKWYERIRECEQIVIDYPKIRFLFSARIYFFDNTELPIRGVFDYIKLPREGDISISEAAEIYFDKDHYNIQLSSYSLIKGIDSLYALRLFCERYQNSILSESDIIYTATRELLNNKIDKMNIEYIDFIKPTRIGLSRNPIIDSISLISEYFYSNIEIEHTDLVDLLSPTLIKYLSVSEIDLLIDYLSNNAILIKSEKILEGVINKKISCYNIAYQTIIEHVISESVYNEIKNGKIDRIPKNLFNGMIRQLDDIDENDYLLNPFVKAPNKRIIQDIVNSVFVNIGRLIGEDDFLITGFEQDEIFKMQMEALANAPYQLAEKYKEKVDLWFYENEMSRLDVLRYLIIPSSNSNVHYFGAEYLHSILMNQPNTFERDKLWSGLDYTEKRKYDSDCYFYDSSFDVLKFDHIHLFDGLLHDELPLIYAWGLSTVNQKLRNELRITLTEWAISSPNEFLLLLSKIFNCNDPQIQEDLASIMLGVASKNKDKEAITKLALWSLNNIFNQIDIHRNIIIRQGFRAIVEKAYKFRVISIEEVNNCKPKRINKIQLLPLDTNYLRNLQEESYPIVHDLAWYVIKKSYNDFLEYPFPDQDNDCIEAKEVLDEYRKKYNNPNLFAHEWGMAAAIAYIKNLGLLRTSGNGFTQASHGQKSDSFTYEEKYTWLAVHYLQGYLSDYIPLKSFSNKREFIQDYSQLSDISNPSESIKNIDKISDRAIHKKDWIIKETLSKELIIEEDIKSCFENWVNEEPNLSFESWLCFNSGDFNLFDQTKQWLALYNETSLMDSNQLCFTSFEARGCVIKKDDFSVLKNSLRKNIKANSFISNISNLHSTPSTDTYCNPSDIVWMSWIEEDGVTQTFYDFKNKIKKEIAHTLTRVIKNNIDGEKYFMLPSKQIRNLIHIDELDGDELIDINQNIVAFYHKISENSHREYQEMTLVEYDLFKKAIFNEGLDIVWFVEIFKQKNPLNKSIDQDFQVHKVYKYLVWIKNDKFCNLKIGESGYKNE